MRTFSVVLMVVAAAWFGACDSAGSSGAAGPGASQGAAGSGGEAPGGGGAGGGGAAPGAALSDCKAACVKVDEAMCPMNKPGECAGLCDTYAKNDKCAAQFASYSACAEATPWACTNGLANPTNCKGELDALIACVQANPGSPGNPGAGTGDRSKGGSFFCEKTVCSGEAGQKACCLKLSITGVMASCVADIATCGQDSRIECDGAEDCGTTDLCCWSNPSTGMGQIIVGVCQPKCNALLGEKETCNKASGGFCSKGICCQAAGDDFGTCQPDEATCQAELMMNMSMGE